MSMSQLAAKSARYPYKDYKRNYQFAIVVRALLHYLFKGTYNWKELFASKNLEHIYWICI